MKSEDRVPRSGFVLWVWLGTTARAFTLFMDQLVVLHESMFMICFMKNIKFGDMMKLFYKFVDTTFWILCISH